MERCCYSDSRLFQRLSPAEARKKKASSSYIPCDFHFHNRDQILVTKHSIREAVTTKLLPKRKKYVPRGLGVKCGCAINVVERANLIHGVGEDISNTPLQNHLRISQCIVHHPNRESKPSPRRLLLDLLERTFGIASVVVYFRSSSTRPGAFMPKHQSL